MRFTEIIKINHKISKHIVVHKVYTNNDFIESKLVIIILKKGRLYVHRF